MTDINPYEPPLVPAKDPTPRFRSYVGVFVLYSLVGAILGQIFLNPFLYFHNPGAYGAAFGGLIGLSLGIARKFTSRSLDRLE